MDRLPGFLLVVAGRFQKQAENDPLPVRQFTLATHMPHDPGYGLGKHLRLGDLPFPPRDQFKGMKALPERGAHERRFGRKRSPALLVHRIDKGEFTEDLPA